MSNRSQVLTVKSEPFDLSNSVATDVLTSKYFATDIRFPYWTLTLSTTTVGATISVKVYASNEVTQSNPALREYVDITADLYGGAINLTSLAAIALAVDTPLLYDSYRVDFDSDIAAVWTARGKKGTV
jgi:hypothetical protein